MWRPGRARGAGDEEEGRGAVRRGPGRGSAAVPPKREATPRVGEVKNGVA